MNRNDRDLKGYLLILTLFVLIALFIFLGGLTVGNELSEDEKRQTSENIVYHNDSSETTTIRYKYELGYESLEKLDSNEGPIYTLYVNDEVVAEAFTPVNLPVVSESEKVKKDNVVKDKFYVDLNYSVNKENIRIDVKIVIEELKGGKWSPAYQVILMERGPYWSLDKGPIEVLE